MMRSDLSKSHLECIPAPRADTMPPPPLLPVLVGAAWFGLEFGPRLAADLARAVPCAADVLRRRTEIWSTCPTAAELKAKISMGPAWGQERWGGTVMSSCGLGAS